MFQGLSDIWGKVVQRKETDLRFGFKAKLQEKVDATEIPNWRIALAQKISINMSDVIRSDKWAKAIIRSVNDVLRLFLIRFPIQ